MGKTISHTGAKTDARLARKIFAPSFLSLRLGVKLLLCAVLAPCTVTAQNGTIDWARYQDMAVDLMQKGTRELYEIVRDISR